MEGFMFNGMFLGIATLLSIVGAIGLLVLLALKDKDGDSIGRILAQVTSAKWILTVLAGLSFLFFAASVVIVIIHQRDKIEPALAVSMMGNLLILIQSVYNMYFNRKDINTLPVLNPQDQPTDTMQAKKPQFTNTIPPMEIKPPEQK